MQMTFDQLDRATTKRRLNSLENYILRLMEENPLFREICERNRLIRYVWDNRDPYENSESITRLQRKILAERPDLDTEKNIKKRANRECAVREFVTHQL